MISELMGKYLWLVQTLERAGSRGLTLREIQTRWEDRWGEDYPRRTFNNHRTVIEDFFGISIGCRRGDNAYFIEDSYDETEGGETFRWMMDSMAMSELPKLREKELKGRVAIEQIPKGRDYLLLLTDAMLNNVKLSVAYQKYSSTEQSVYTLHPYALKEYSRRWYLVAWCEERDAVRVYALDRIVGIEPGLEKFEMPKDFDVDGLFRGCYGVYLPDEGARLEHIVFRTSASEAKYLQDLPIHPTQKKVADDGDRVTFEMYVYMNRNLMMDFLSRGSGIEILEPSSLRSEIQVELTKAKDLYE